MKHLFVVNPKAFGLKGRSENVIREIRAFFANYPQLKYDIHVTRWKRDAVGFTHRYVSGAPEIVRVYAVGGMGTVFEVINGIIGMPNVQVTTWPFGIDNSFLFCLGDDIRERFRSLRNLVFSGVSSFDLIRCGNNYGICAGFMGVEADASQQGDMFIERTGLFTNWSNGIYFAAAIYNCLRKGAGQPYNVTIDGLPVNGEYISILVANQPYYAKGMYPAVDAKPNDGILDVYLVRKVPGLKLLTIASDYIKGRYHKWSRYISHFQGKAITVSSEQMMSICLDGELFYDSSIDFQVIPHAVDFVCPKKDILPKKDMVPKKDTA
jgi:diacylglycerol kinase family enzyme